VKQRKAARSGGGAAATSHEDQKVGGGKKAGKWKAESNQFREAMKAAREYAKAKKSGAPMPDMPSAPSAPDPSLILCENCGRRFNEKAAERHIPKCQSIKAKPNRLKAGGGITAAGGRSRGAPKGGRDAMGSMGGAPKPLPKRGGRR